MATLTDIRQQYPQYNNLSDEELATKLYDKFYAGKISRDDFNKTIGLQPTVAPLPPTGTPVLTNPAPSYGRVSAPPSWAKPVDQGTDIKNSILSNLATSTMGIAGLPGDIQSMTSQDGPLPAWSNFGKIPFPTTRQIEGAANTYTGFTPYKSQTDLGNVFGSAASLAPTAVGSVATGGLRALPWALARATGAGAIGGEAGNIAAGKYGEEARPWAQLGGDILAGYGITKAGGTAARVATRVAAPAAADLPAAASALYTAANKAGVYVKPDTIEAIYKDVIQAGWDKGLREGRPSTEKATQAATALAAEVLRIGKNGRASLEDLRTMKEILRDAAPEGSAAAGAMSAKLMDRIDNLTANDIVGGVDPKEALNFVKAGNDLWKQKSKGEIIDKIISDAKLLQTPDKPGAYPNALRQGFLKLAKDPMFEKYWTPDEQYAIKTVIAGGGIFPALTRLTGTAISTGGIVPGLNIAGWGLRGIGNMGRTQAADYASALARSGPKGNPFTTFLPVPRTTKDLAAALIGGTVPFRAP